MPWKKMLALVTGQMDDALRQKREFVLEANRVYRAWLDRHVPHWRLQDSQRHAFAQKGKPLGQLLREVITLAQPATLLKWHRQREAHQRPPIPGRPPVDADVAKRVLQLARDNPSWG